MTYDFITDVNLTRWLIGTGVLFVLLFIFYLFTVRLNQRGLQGFGTAGLPRRMRLLESLPVGPKRSLHLVRIDHTDFILSQSEHGLELLEYADAHPLASAKLPPLKKQV